MHSSPVRRAFAATALAAASFCAQAGAFSDLVVFGDSLSDTGNLSLITGGAFPDVTTGPYFQGRFSDGLVWIDHLAANLGLPLGAVPSLLGGHNYAVAGARTNGGSLPSLLVQELGWWAPAHPAADPNALYVVVGGGNDMRDARSAFTGNSAADQAGRAAAADAAIANLQTSIGVLAARGAEHILISNLPDLGRTPEAVFLGLTAASTDATNQFNARVKSLLAFGNSMGVTMSFLDMAGVAAKVYDDAVNNGGAVYGLVNAQAPCNGFLGSPNQPFTACNVSLFSDALHPSAAAQRLIGEAAINAVPEPETYALMALGLAALALQVRRRARRA